MVNTWNTDKDRVVIKDQLGNDPDTTPILVPDFNETLIIEEGPTVLFTGNIASSSACIYDHPTRGLFDSGFVYAAEPSTIPHTVIQVLNPNNEFREHFRVIADAVGTHNNRYTQYTLIDLANTTASVTSGSVSFDAGEVLQSRCFAYSSTATTFTNAYVTASGTTVTMIDFSIGTASGPTSTAITWQSVSQQTNTTLTSPNYALFYKGSATATSILTDLKINYG